MNLLSSNSYLEIIKVTKICLFALHFGGIGGGRSKGLVPFSYNFEVPAGLKGLIE